VPVNILKKVYLTIEGYDLIRKKETVLCAVSGGPDSVAMLHILKDLNELQQLEWQLHVAHVNHGLRGKASDEDEQFVRGLAEKLKIPFHSSTVDVKGVQKKERLTQEEAGRKLRHAYLEEKAAELGAKKIALAHNLDDQAETVLMWILRGTGTSGLAGIPPVREVPVPPHPSPLPPGERGKWWRKVRIIRPLIGCSRTEVETHLKGLGVRPLQDETNRSEAFLRNRIRNRLIPTLERQFNPQLRRRLAALAEILREDLDWMEDQTLRLFSEAARVRGKVVRLERERLRRSHPALRRSLLRLAVSRLQGDTHGFAQRHWLEMERLLLGDGQGGTDFPHGFRAEGVKGGKTLLIVAPR
jgi:tRNA(Ile)-lysidine synthase